MVRADTWRTSRSPARLRAVFVRSIIPHGRITGIEGVEAARSMPGVVAVYTADDLRIAPQTPSGNVEGASGTLEGPFGRPVLARDVVRYVGEAVAVVIADTLAHRAGRRGGGLALGRPARRGDGRGDRCRGRRAAVVPRQRVEHRARVRAALGRGRARGSRRRRPRADRAAAPGARADGDERDRRDPRGRRRVHDLVLDAGAVRRPERPGRAAAGRQEAGARGGARRRRRLRREAARRIRSSRSWRRRRRRSDVRSVGQRRDPRAC